MFSNREAGCEIFEHWRSELGKIDKEERIRLAIVRGVDVANPYTYRVIVGSNLTTFPADAQLITMISRVHQMDATTPDNLNCFIDAHSAMGVFYLVPAFAPEGFDGSQSPPVLDLIRRYSS